MGYTSCVFGAIIAQDGEGCKQKSRNCDATEEPVMPYSVIKRFVNPVDCGIIGIKGR